MNNKRFRLFREHKYLFAVFSSAIQKLATLDCSNKEAVLGIKQEVQGLLALYESHSSYEDSRIGKMLAEKNSSLANHLAEDHQAHKAVFFQFYCKLMK